MPQHRLDSVQNSYLFYRKNYFNMTFMSIALVCLNIMVVCGTLYLRWTKPEPNYYISTTDGKILPASPIR